MSHMHESDSETADRRWIPALALILSGISIGLLLLVDQADGLPFSMPRSWYTARWIWVLGGLTMIVGGFRLFGRSAAARQRLNERRRIFRNVVVYTRDGCHLCDDAIELLRRYDWAYPELEEVDIDADPELREQFDTCVPVVEIDGRVRFRGQVSEILLERLIEGTRRGSSG